MAVRRLLAVLTLLFATAVLYIAGSTASARSSSLRPYDSANLDKTCKPCDDFAQFAGGGWRKSHPIPSEYPVWGSFLILGDENQKKMRAILEAAAENKQSAPGSNDQKIGDFYASCIDTVVVDSEGTKPLQPALDEIASLKSKEELAAPIAHLHEWGVHALFDFGSTPDFKDSSKIIAEADQSGLGLPDRDYYTRTDEESKALRQKYANHIARMLTLLGDSPEKASAEAKVILQIETQLAVASMTNVELRSPETQYHILDLTGLKQLTPHFSWPTYFKAAGHAEFSSINVAQPAFFKAMDEEIASRSLEDWKTYLRWHLVDRMAPSLSAPFVTEDFDFSSKTLTGAKDMPERWKRCSRSVDRNLGQALGQLYVRKYFSADAKARMLDMVHDLTAALREDIPTLAWMGPETKKAAIAKLDAFGVKIGYPDKWLDYSALKIERGSHAANVGRAYAFETARDLNKVGKPRDLSEWQISPITVDAFYSGQRNEIVFPAGILQPPFFDTQRDDAYNYGAIGAVIGHEITHGFDDQGAKFDPQGNLRNWWAQDDLKNFQERGQCVADQFSGYMVAGDLHENGKLVEGESIADLGGLAIAYAAYQKHMQLKPPVDDGSGFTPAQRFFLGFAQVWTFNARAEFEKLQANTDPHALPRFRSNGPLSNMTEFAAAFACKKGDPMVRQNACRIW